jgi:hypothetical protein
MMRARRAVDESPMSDFVVKLGQWFLRREAARDAAPDVKRRLEREAQALMSEHLGGNATADTQGSRGDVPRDTATAEVDRKLASVGPEGE